MSKRVNGNIKVYRQKKYEMVLYKSRIYNKLCMVTIKALNFLFTKSSQSMGCCTQNILSTPVNLAQMSANLSPCHIPSCVGP